MRKFSHLVEINESDRQLSIYRVFGDGTKELFTRTELPAVGEDGKAIAFGEFCRLLGENLIFDSPTACKLLNLE